MMRIVFIFLCWIVAFKKSDWRNWKNYQPTILFMIAGNFMVGLISYRYTLWDLSSELGGHLINDFLLSILFFPPLVLIYLTNYPVNQGIIKKVLYISFWALLSTTIEGIEYTLENIRYDHSWSLWKSLLFNLVLFPTITIHHTRPLLAYVLFLIETILLISICGIPWSSFK